MKNYLRCVAGVDRNVGRVLAELDKAGLSENTIVVYCADQGFYLGEHGWFDKRWAYEESLKMPLIVRWPGKVKPGTRVRGDGSEHRLRADSYSRRLALRRTGMFTGSV